MTTRRLDRIIEIQRRVVTRDSFGSEVETWAELETVWANVNQTGADEAFRNEANREVATRDARMTIHYRDDIDETMRVIYDERAWDIRGIAEIGFKNKLELLVQANIGSERHPFTGYTLMGGLSIDDIPEAGEITISPPTRIDTCSYGGWRANPTCGRLCWRRTPLMQTRLAVG